MKIHYCKSGLLGQPFSLSQLVRKDINDTLGYDTLCTTVRTRWCNPRAECCGMDFTKLEAIISPECRSQVNELTINGQPKALSTTNYKDFNAAGFKYTNLTLGEVDGTVFCFNVYGACRDPAVLAMNGRLQFAVFDETHDCCPTFWLWNGGDIPYGDSYGPMRRRQAIESTAKSSIRSGARSSRRTLSVDEATKVLEAEESSGYLV